MSGFRIRSVPGAGLSSRDQDGNTTTNKDQSVYALEPMINSKNKKGQSNKDLANLVKNKKQKSPMNKSESTGFAEKTYSQEQ